MNNRRSTGTETSKPYYKKNTQRKPEDRESGDRGYPPRDNRFKPRGTPNFRGGDDRKRDPNSRFRPKDQRFGPKGRPAVKGKGPKPWEKAKTPKIVSDMQITDGKHKGKYLTTTESKKVRPTSRRIREVMFRILYRRVKAGRILDLCAGSGTIGLEAISRGALIATFVERSAKMCSFIKKNMEALGIKEGHGEVFNIEVVPFLKQMKKRKREWDVIYFDPPYDSNYDEVLEIISRGAALKKRGVLIVEHPAEMFFPEDIGQLHRWRVLVQGDTALSFFDRR